MESYKHKFAKETLASWCRDGFGFKAHRYVITVHVEYPVCIDADNLMWGIEAPWAAYDVDGGPFHYERCIELGLLPLVIFDVMVLHNGQPAMACEVVHKHDISETKAKYLNRVFNCLDAYHLNFLKIDADEVLSHPPGRPRPDRVQLLEFSTPDGRARAAARARTAARWNNWKAGAV